MDWGWSSLKPRFLDLKSVVFCPLCLKAANGVSAFCASVALNSAPCPELEHMSRIIVEAQLQHVLVKRASSLDHQHV